MSNNPVLPPPNMDDFEATMIREKYPLAEQTVTPYISPSPPATAGTTAVVKPKPRRAKPNNDIWTYIALGGYFAIAGFTSAFLGTLLANIL